MALSDGINLYWVKVNVDGIFQISGGVPDINGIRSSIVPSDEGSIYISGDTPAGELTFGIAGHDAGFVPFPNGNFNVPKRINHGIGVVILCQATGIAAAGKTIYVAYASRSS